MLYTENLGSFFFHFYFGMKSKDSIERKLFHCNQDDIRSKTSNIKTVLYNGS